MAGTGSSRSPARLVVVGLLGLFCAQSAWLWLLAGPQNSPEAVLSDVEQAPLTEEEIESFMTPRIEQVTEGVYVALGFGLVNSILLEGPESLIVIDTTTSRDVAAQIRQHFRNVSSKPIRDIIYTHFHTDHTYGVKGFIDDPEDPPDIWAHEEFLNQMQVTVLTGKAGLARARKMFGIFLPKSVGLLIDLGFDKTFRSAPIFPNKLLREKRLAVNIAGVDLELLHIPGETDDHMAVYWPEKKVVCTGDNIYQSFPNLYTIRGTPSRDVLKWAESLDVIRDLNAEHLVPSHTLPIHGRVTIDETLTVYRDAIQFVHDQTVRFMNRGMHPDDIVPRVKLPAHLVDHPYLTPVYGTVEWSVRGVFDSYMGWFSGDVTELSPLETEDKSKKMIELAGGRENMLKKAQQAYDKGEYQWALELSSHVFHIHKDYEVARQLRSQCLKQLAKQQTSSNGRNFYLAQAIEDYNFGDGKVNPKAMLKELPMSILLRALTVRVDAEQCHDRNAIAVFVFTDTGEVYSLQLRNGVMVILNKVPSEWDVKMTTSTVIWKEIMTKERSPFASYVLGDIVIEGGVMAFRSFMSCIE